jgi:hypothetical protein
LGKYFIRTMQSKIQENILFFHFEGIINKFLLFLVFLKILIQNFYYFRVFTA